MNASRLASFSLLCALLPAPAFSEATHAGMPQEPANSAQLQKVQATGRVVTTKGTVTAVTCQALAIEVILDTGASSLTLRADDYRKVELTAETGKILPGFSICEHLANLKVTARYRAAPPNAGQLIAIQLP